jgi:hypothetical protein
MRTIPAWHRSGSSWYRTRNLGLRLTPKIFKTLGHGHWAAVRGHGSLPVHRTSPQQSTSGRLGSDSESELSSSVVFPTAGSRGTVRSSRPPWLSSPITTGQTPRASNLSLSAQSTPTKMHDGEISSLHRRRNPGYCIRIAPVIQLAPPFRAGACAAAGCWSKLKLPEPPARFGAPQALPYHASYCDTE